MERGQLVTVKDAWGEKLVRRVVNTSDLKIWVCRSEEFDKALLEHREPNSIGFPVGDVVMDSNFDRHGALEKSP